MVKCPREPLRRSALLIAASVGSIQAMEPLLFPTLRIQRDWSPGLLDRLRE
jgi:hypothetical protein